MSSVVLCSVDLNTNRSSLGEKGLGVLSKYAFGALTQSYAVHQGEFDVFAQQHTHTTQ